jgi:hypothetical protein
MWIVTAPWVLAKNKATRKQLETVIYNLLEGLRLISGLIYPVMPDTAANMQKHLGFSGEDDFYKLDRLVTWRGGGAGCATEKIRIPVPPHRPGQKSNRNPSNDSELGKMRQTHQTGNQHRRFCQNRPAGGHGRLGSGCAPGPETAPAGS